MNKKFILIGDGRIAKFHKKAIDNIGGTIICIADPKYDPCFNKNTYRFIESVPTSALNQADFYVICSETNLHRQQIVFLLKYMVDSNFKKPQIICEKPAFLPWEPAIDSNKINIVLQLRYLPNLPEKADLVSVRFVRDEAYFKSWKGDARKTGGLFYNLFLHGIDLAMQLGADFEGKVISEGKQERWIGTKYSEWHFWSNGVKYSHYENIDDKGKIDILNIDTQACYNKLYEAILEGKGIKPSDLFYLNWILQRNSEIFGYGRDGIGKTITIKNELM